MRRRTTAKHKDPHLDNEDSASARNGTILRTVYFIESIRPANWKPDATIQAAIDETLQRVPQLKKAVGYAQAFRAEEAKKRER